MLLIYMSFIDDESHRRLFEEIYLSYRKQMFLVARTVLKNDSDAEDIVHDVFLRIAKKYMAKISTIENETDLRNYLLKATKNAALDHLRKHRHERVRTEEENETDVPDSEEMPDDALVEKIHDRIEYKKIVSAIASMGDIYRDVSIYESAGVMVAVWLHNQYAFNLTVYGDYGIDLMIKLIDSVQRQ